VLYALEMLEGMRRVLLCMLEVPRGDAPWRLRMLEAVEVCPAC